jgi:outer membrane protein OmpA-like peptidoglycan-associated protein
MPAVEVDTVTFGFNEDFVREEQMENLDRIGGILEEILAEHPQEVFLVEGHTDAVGDDAYNLDLSRRRAESIKTALTQYYEIGPENLRTVGYGERYLKIPTEEPEEENRRITIRRITPAVGAQG